MLERLIFILIWSCITARAPVKAAEPPLRFTQVGEAQGLSHRAVNSMLQDRTGFLWLATANGMNRFDGHSMKVFLNEPSKTDTLTDNWVTTLFEDANGILWIGAGGKLQSFDTVSQEIKSFPLVTVAGEALDAQQINSISDDGAGGLWLGTASGLVHVDLKKRHAELYRTDNPESGKADAVWALARDRKSNLWIGTGTGLQYLPAGSRQIQRLTIPNAGRHAAAPTFVRALLLPGDGSLWIGTDAGVRVRSADGAFLALPAQITASGTPFNLINALARDSTGSIWAGTKNGLLRWDAAGNLIARYRHHPDDPASIASESVLSLCLDRTGNLWIGTELAGASKVDLSTSGFEHFQHRLSDRHGLSNSQVSGISGNGRGSVWLATLYGGLNRLDTATGEVSSSKPAPGTANNTRPVKTRSIYCGPDGTLWVGTMNGLMEIPPGKEQGRMLYLARDLPGSAITRTIIRDRENWLWIGTEGGLLRYHPPTQKVQRFVHDVANPHSLSGNMVFAVHEDRAGRIWVGSAGGLDLYQPHMNGFQRMRLPTQSGVTGFGRVFSLADDWHGKLWIGTPAGLHLLEVSSQGKGRVQTYGVAQGLASPWIASILAVQSTGQVWFSTRAGISVLEHATGKVENFTTRERVLEGGYFIGSAYADDNGALYFGSPSGLTRVRPANIRKNIYPPTVAITDVQLFNRSLDHKALPSGVSLNGPITSATKFSLAHGLNVFSLEFAALHFADTSQNRYAYMLEGFDKDWVYVGAGKPSVTYTNLDPGNYMFKVKAANKEGIWSLRPAELAVEILPPFWRTWWFRAAAFTSLALALYLGHYYRLRRLVAQKTALSRQVEERTAEVRWQQSVLIEQKNRIEIAHNNITLLSDIGKQLTASLDREVISEVLYKHVGDLMPCDAMCLASKRERSGFVRTFWAHAGKIATTQELEPWQIVLADSCADIQAPVVAGAPTTDAADLNWRELPGFPPVTYAVAVPLILAGTIAGVVIVESYGVAFQRIHVDMLQTLASYAAAALEKADAYQQLEVALQELTETQQQLVLSEKMAGVGTLTAGVAHEINNPANFAHAGAQVIDATLKRFRNFLFELAGDDTDPEVIEAIDTHFSELHEQTATVYEGTSRIRDLVKDLRTFSRLDEAEWKTAAVAEGLASVVRLVRLQYAAVTTVQLEVHSDAEITCWPAQLNQACLNILVNACQAVMARWPASEPPHGAVTIQESVRDASIYITCEDNGCGMTPEQLDRIFEPFYTTKPVGAGVGLGLSIAYTIIKSHGGTITASSTLGKGSCFIIMLPLIRT